jgi:tripartite-type tricarboxylate transporter receptor subunit TctC
MKLTRRKFLLFGGATAVAPVFPRRANALDYPTRQVRLIVAAAAGNTTDIFARIIAQWLTRRLRQPFVVENRPGGGSNIGTEVVVGAPPDGYTLLLISMGNFINASLYEELSFNFIRDISPVASIMRHPNVMEVIPSFPASTVSEFVAYAKANPGKINFASPGIGTSIHLCGEMFKMLTGVNMVHVPYRGTGAALTDLLSGEVQVMFDNLPSSIEYIRGGKLRPMAVTSAKRWGALPDVPTIAEFVTGFETSPTAGIGVPKNTPVEIVDKLNMEINAGLADPNIKARIADLGAEPFALSPAAYEKFIADETDKWAKVVRFSGAKPG